MKSVTIVIPHMNQAALLAKCLESLAQQTTKPNMVVVVDNGSTDTTPEVIRVAANTLSVHTISLGRNTGFAYAVNRGIEYALDSQSAYIMVLNNDTVLDSLCIEELVDTFEQGLKNVAAVQPIILNAFHPEKVDSAGISITKDMSAINLNQGKIYEEPKDYLQEIFGATGCAVLFSADALREVFAVHGEYFDEDYFAYYEDVDMAWRLRYLGYRSYCNHHARLYHVHSATGKNYSPFKSFYVHRNHWFNIIKNSPTWTFFEIVPRMIIRYGLLLSSAIIGKGPSHRLRQNTGGANMVAIVAQSWIELVKILPRLISKRKKTHKSQKVTRAVSIGWITRFNATIASTVYSER